MTTATRTRRPKTPERTLGVIGYARVSTEQQAESGAGLADQEQTIRAEAARRGLPVLHVYVDAGLSAKDMRHRPELILALTELDAGRGSILMVAKTDRLTRDTLDLCTLLQHAVTSGWAFVTLDFAQVDTATPTGRAFVQMCGVFAELERAFAMARTRAALGVKKQQGVKLGRTSLVDPEIIEQMLDARLSGQTFAAIAKDLNRRGIPTPQGNDRRIERRTKLGLATEWYPASVRAVLDGHRNRMEREAYIAAMSPAERAEYDRQAVLSAERRAARKALKAATE